MKRTRLWLIGAIVAGLIAVAAGVGIAATGDDDQQLTGDALDRAVTAALRETGGGEVLETEVGDDGAAYGVEIRTSDGRVVEINLDEDFRVIGSETDDDGADGAEDDDAGETETG
jgi:uncharacterized membrane protein YkoI